MKFYDNVYFFFACMLSLFLICCSVIALIEGIGPFGIVVAYSSVALIFVLKNASDDYEELREMKRRKREEERDSSRKDASAC